jgi:hypothetical protein
MEWIKGGRMMKKRIRYTANDDHYHQPPAHKLPWIVRQLLGFCAGFTIVSIMLFLVFMVWN